MHIVWSAGGGGGGGGRDGGWEEHDTVLVDPLEQHASPHLHDRGVEGVVGGGVGGQEREGGVGERYQVTLSQDACVEDITSKASDI